MENLNRQSEAVKYEDRGKKVKLKLVTNERYVKRTRLRRIKFLMKASIYSTFVLGSLWLFTVRTDAPLFGLLFGVLFTVIWQYQPRVNSRYRKKYRFSTQLSSCA